MNQLRAWWRGVADAIVLTAHRGKKAFRRIYAG
jgi:hypothetical protein